MGWGREVKKGCGLGDDTEREGGRQASPDKYHACGVLTGVDTKPG